MLVRMREYLRIMLDTDREKASASPVLFFLGRVLGVAAGLAFLMQLTDVFHLSLGPADPTRRLVTGAALGACLALRDLWVNRWRLPPTRASRA